jgi:hypothetical protein
MAHDIGTLYSTWGMLNYRDYLISALKNLLGYEPLTKVNIGSSGRVTTQHQANKRRYTINITYAAPKKRGMAEIIDEITPIYDINIEIKIPEIPTRVLVPLKDQELKFKTDGNKISFTLPKIWCHESVVIEY